VPGIEISEQTGAHLPRLTRGSELRRFGPSLPLAIPDPAATAATVLAAASEASRGEVAVWSWVIAGGAPTTVTTTDRTTAKPEDVRLLASLRIAAGGPASTAPECVARLRRAAASVSVPGGRLVPRALPNWLAARRVDAGASPVVTGATPVSLAELTALCGWPIAAPAVPGLRLGRSPQLAPSFDVPRSGRILGDSTIEPVRPVAVRPRPSTQHALWTGPTGSGKSWLAAAVALQDIAAGRGVTVIDPKGSLVRLIAERLPEEALDRVVWPDPTDEAQPVPLPLLTPDAKGYPELAADTLIGLLRHRFQDLGPRSSDILTSSLYSLARTPGATILDLLRLWTDEGYRRTVVGRVSRDPALSSFWAWFDTISPGERAFATAAPTNKIRPLIQRSSVRNVIAAPRATFSFADALSQNLIVFVSLPEGELGREAAGLIGQVVLARLWAAVQARRTRRPYFVTVDEAQRFLDQPTDLGDVLALAREYGVGYQLLTQTAQALPERLREVAMNSARTKLSFQTSARETARLAGEFGPLVTADMLGGLGEYEAIAAVATGGAVSEPFTLRTRALPDPETGRLAAVRAASRKRYGVPRAEIEASFARPAGRGEDASSGDFGPVGRRPRS